MTAFIKENFSWDGMYLMYEGEQGETARYYGEDGEKCHPTRKGMAKPLFIARFKYGRKPWKTWVNFIVKNFTVEEWAERSALGFGGSPVAIMRSKGFLEPSERKFCKKYGLEPTPENWTKAVMIANGHAA